MTFKRYIFLLLSGALVLFLSLPLFNYSVDQWRVLHLDYKNTYNGIEPNKNYLKMSYLLKHKDAYDTLLMGSSRVGHIDTDLLPGRAYNMTISSGVVGVHLENLKILLQNGVKIKQIWLGINDFVIWTYPGLNKTDYLRISYGGSLWENLKVFKYYLFKIPRKRDVQIFLGQKYKLVEYPVISTPQIFMDWSRLEEKRIVEFAEQHRQKMLEIPPAIPPKSHQIVYRVDAVVAEFAALKQLCDTHGIALTTFIVPSYYKTYLGTDQYQIQDLKRKLVNITAYHDFYELNEIALDDSKWFDAVHFVPSIGDYIVDSIKAKRFLVNKETFSDHFHKQQGNESALLNQMIWARGLDRIYAVPYYVTLQEGKTIFNLLTDQGQYEKNFEIDFSDSVGRMKLKHNDPILKLKKMAPASANVVLRYTIDCSKETTFDLFYKKGPTDHFSTEKRFQASLKKGRNELTLMIPSLFVQNGLRVDLVSAKGDYSIREFKIVEGDVRWAE